MKKKLILSSHDKVSNPPAPSKLLSKTEISDHHLIINSATFPGVKPGELFRIIQEPLQQTEAPKLAHTDGVLLKLVSVTSTKGAPEISLSKTICDKFGFQIRKPVLAEKVDFQNAAAEYAEISLINQYLSRSDMMKLKMSLLHSCVYVGQKISFACSKSTVKELILRGKPVESGFVSESTKFVFRSRSAQMFFLFQMSKEMWDISLRGDMYFEIAVNQFMKELNKRWSNENNHSLSVVFFSRTYYAPDHPVSEETDAILRDYDGRRYQDFYKVIFLDRKISIKSQILELKKAFTTYPTLVNWSLSNISQSTENVNNNESSPSLFSLQHKITSWNSTATQGNILEAVNLALDDLFTKNFCDQDLTSTGSLLVVISPGTGVFETSSHLAQITKARLIDSGTGMDLVCIRNPPLHAVPLFKFKDRIETQAEKLVYDIPHWIHISMFGTFLQKSSQAPFGSFEPASFIDTGIAPKSEKPSYIPLSSISPVYNSIRETVSVVSPAASRQDSSANLSSSPETSPNMSVSPSALDFEKLIATIGSMDSTSTSYEPEHHLELNPTESLRKLRTLPKKQKTGLNPFSNEYSIPKRSSSRRRWMHIFTPGGASKYVNLYPFHIPWKSLTEPASLPLTTDYFPSTKELNSYEEFIYSVVTHPHVIPELVAQRINCGFQLIRSSVTPHRQEYSLGLGHHYHLISYDPSFSNSIQIKRYQWKEKKDIPAYSYAYSLCPAESTLTFSKKTRVISHSQALTYPWNYIDQIICGDAIHFPSDIKFWRIGFIVFPKLHQHESLSVTGSNCSQIYDTRIQNFLKFKNMVAQSEDFQVSVYDPSKPPPDDSTLGTEDLNELALALRDPETGIEISDRSYMLRTFKDCFVSQELVNWIVQNCGVPKDQALNVCQRLFQESWIEHVSGRTTFDCGFYFYRFIKLPKEQGPRFKGGTRKKSDRLNKDCLVSLDKTKTEGANEWIVIKHDSSYDPSQIYHMELNWLIAKGPVVDDFISSMYTKAGLCAINMVQVTLNESSPFRAPIFVPLHEKYNNLARESVACAILAHHFGFLDDLNNIYIHQSGQATLQPESSGGFSVRILPSRPNPKNIQRFDPNRFLTDFQEFCANPEALERLLFPEESPTSEGASSPPQHLTSSLSSVISSDDQERMVSSYSLLLAQNKDEDDVDESMYYSD